MHLLHCITARTAAGASAADNMPHSSITKRTVHRQLVHAAPSRARKSGRGVQRAVRSHGASRLKSRINRFRAAVDMLWPLLLLSTIQQSLLLLHFVKQLLLPRAASSYQTRRSGSGVLAAREEEAQLALRWNRARLGRDQTNLAAQALRRRQ